jgi:hypothetical protein
MRLFCKTQPSSFFFNFIFIFSRLRQGFKNLQKVNLPRFQSTGSPTCDTSWFSKLVFAYRLLQILLSQKLIFNALFF